MTENDLEKSALNYKYFNYIYVEFLLNMENTTVKD